MGENESGNPPDASRPARQTDMEAFRCILATTSSGFWHLDADGTIKDVNHRYSRLSGYTEDELIGMHISDFDCHETPQQTRQHLDQLKTEGFLHFETSHRRKDGTTWDTDVSCSFLDRDGGQVFAFFRDVTDRNRAAAELADQLDFTRRIFNSTDSHLAVVGADGIILSINDAWRRFALENLSDDESAWGVGAHYFRECSREHGDVSLAEEAYAGVRAVQRGELPTFRMEYPCHASKELKRWFALRVFPLRGQQGAVLVSHENVTDRKLAEAALRQSERLLATSQHLPGIGGWEWDVERQAMFWTEEAYRIHDLEPGSDLGEETLARVATCYDTADHEQIGAAFRRCHEEGRSYDLQLPFTTFAGRKLWVRITGEPVTEQGRITRLVGNIMDITRQRSQEQELLKVEKLESLGLLAGGIAHDFNNILTGIMGNLSMLRMHLGEAPVVGKALADAETATDRAAALAHQLLTFARGGAPVKQAVKAPTLIQEAASLSLRGSNVKEEMDLDAAVQIVDADPGQMSQVFNNIIINARQAMPQGGLLRIATRSRELPEGNLLSLPAGPYVEITFTDTGPGISREDQERIFDPYFTTKKTGSGLGLASAHSIVTRHGGSITVDSSPGRGTTFAINLPALHRADPAEESETPADPSENPVPGGTILVMDDEEIIRELATAMLDQLGFEVATCGDGAEAVQRYREALATQRPFQAVLMDLTVPGGLGGREAAGQILDIDPRARLIVSSGYSNDPVLADYRAHGFQGVVAKPYNLAQLQQVVAEVLQEG